MHTDSLSDLVNWYKDQCDGQWERNHGIIIETSDTSGWDVYINIDHTDLQHKKFRESVIRRNDHDWISCSISGEYFLGSGGIFNLPEILDIFMDWALGNLQRSHNVHPLVEWLINWSDEQRKNTQEPRNNIRLGTHDVPGWIVNITLNGTILEKKPFEKVRNDMQNDTWFRCAKQNLIYTGIGGVLSLFHILAIFRAWVKDEEVLSLQQRTNSTGWELVKRFDGEGAPSHWNRLLRREIVTPHIHEADCLGGTRPAEDSEIPRSNVNKKPLPSVELVFDLRTLDNPGWVLQGAVRIATSASNRKVFQEDGDEEDWYLCRACEGRFTGYGGKHNLSDIFHAFMTVNQENALPGTDDEVERTALCEVLEKLASWYVLQCDGDWEHTYGIRIQQSLETKDWFVCIPLQDTDYENRSFRPVHISRRDDDWLDCQFMSHNFEGRCASGNLPELLAVFIDWTTKSTTS